MKELVSAARIGRSLGIHLILATQKPDGVVDDQIWSNSKFKLCLKVAEEADSKALLKTPDAAYITNPGRGYLKVGTNELYELFQSGYSGAPYIESANNELTCRPEVYQLDMYGNKTLLNPEDCTTEAEQEGIQDTELDVVLETIEDTYKQAKLTEVRKPWLPPLKNYSYVPINPLEEIDELRLSVNLGTIDLPNQQAQMDYVVDFEEEGHMIVFASSGMGKTFTAMSVIMKLASQNSPKQMKAFIFDLGDGGLLGLKDLKHTSEYFTLDFDEKQKQFCDFIKKEIAFRKQEFMSKRVSSFKMYNQSEESKMQSIFIVIDSYENLSALDETVINTLKMLIKDGANLGIYLIIGTLSPNDIKQNEMLNFRNILLLHTANSQDVGTVLKKTTLPEQEIPGRGRVLVDDVEVVQVDSPVEQGDPIEQTKMLNELVLAIN
ncbi:MAG: FtsK/SpoIIIE domain-containing protein, partial [Bacilli bacterium]